MLAVRGAQFQRDPARSSAIRGYPLQLTQFVTKKPRPLTACLHGRSSMAFVAYRALNDGRMAGRKYRNGG